MDTWQVWPFAVARHPNAGYRSVLVPGFLTDLGVAHNVRFVLGAHANLPLTTVSPDTVWLQPVQTAAGPFLAAYRFQFTVGADERELRDSSGRVAPLVAGVMIRHGGQAPPDALAVLGLAVSIGTAAGAYAHFAAEPTAEHWPYTSEPFALTAENLPSIPVGLTVEHLGERTLARIRADELAIERDDAQRALQWSNGRAWDEPAVQPVQSQAPVRTSVDAGTDSGGRMTVLTVFGILVVVAIVLLIVIIAGAG